MAEKISRVLSDLIRNKEPIYLETVELVDGINVIHFNGMEFAEVTRDKSRGLDEVVSNHRKAIEDSGVFGSEFLLNIDGKEVGKVPKQSTGIPRETDGASDIVYQETPKEPVGITVKLDVDVSEALTGLKAVQREAKVATVALRELERASKHTPVEINDLRDVQGQDGNWDYSEYMCGMFNGLELASATLEGRTPDYREIEK